MQSSRLLSILLRLQTDGRVTAQALAESFEVSVRTLYRDIDALGVVSEEEGRRRAGLASTQRIIRPSVSACSGGMSLNERPQSSTRCAASGLPLNAIRIVQLVTAIGGNRPDFRASQTTLEQRSRSVNNKACARPAAAASRSSVGSVGSASASSKYSAASRHCFGAKYPS
ncbi:MAG: HTH domain-containing protein [Planctomycetes bacterium]|nr:HTH domain-containing protein [Planctomycetota bacterium]